MNPQDLFARLQTAAAALSSRQMISLALAFVSVVGITIASAYWLNTPTYDVLFSGLDSEAAGAVLTRLKASKVDYKLEDGGRTVMVPNSRINELRLDIASQGMPGTGRVGFEIFDRTSFGVTDFMEHVNYRRALEGELARTIASIGEVAGARVHIALPQQSIFSGSQEKTTTASVVLKLRENRKLPASTVNAIAGLVAASVESLRPESVVVIDNFGRSLSKPSAAGEEANGGEQMERQQRIEQEMSTRLVALLEPIVGAERVHVNVNAKLSTDSQEETEERWDPTPIVRSRQSMTQAASVPVNGTMAAGARANLPPPTAGPALAVSAPPPLVQGNSSVAETTNYEVSKLTRHRVQPRGDIARLSVAVVVDDNRTAAQEGQAKGTPRTAEEIQKIHDLVAASVGLDAMRGDQLTVENIAFEEAPVEKIAPVPVWERYQPQAFEAGRILAIVLISLLALFGVVRPMVRGSLDTRPALAAAGSANRIQPRTVKDLESEIDAELDAAASAAPRRLPTLTRRAATLTEKEPEQTARLLRAWLAEEER